MSFEKNAALDELIVELNDLLEPVEQILISNLNTEVGRFPTLFLIGNPRSGSTLLMQWAASLEIFAYPSNFLSRFNRAPYVGALIYKMVTDPEYQYKGEFSDIRKSLDFASSLGKTKGFTAPHEFWYFWRRFMEFQETPVKEEYFENNFDFQTFQYELRMLKEAFGKPFIMKGQILNWYLKTVSKKMKNSIYIHLHRNPISVCRSLLKARENWYGSREEWFSAKPREYKLLAEMDVYHQVAGQVYFINKEIETKKSHLGDTYLRINYQDFCEQPGLFYNRLREKISMLHPDFDLPDYKGIRHFKESDKRSSDDIEVEEAYSYFEKKYGRIST